LFQSDILAQESQIMMPSWIDIIIAAILIFSLWRGWRNGFIYELALLCAFFTGLYAGFKFAWFIQDKISHWFSLSHKSASEISFFVMFVLVFVATILLGKLFSSLVNVTPLGILNKILGAVFSLGRYALILSLVLWFMKDANGKYKLVPVTESAKSKLITPFDKIAPAVLPVLNKIQKEIKENMSI
jgi:membrane protein required for colicin V production